MSVVCRDHLQGQAACHSPGFSSLAAGPLGWGCRCPAVCQLSFCSFANSAAFKLGSTVSQLPSGALQAPPEPGLPSTLCQAERRCWGTEAAWKAATLPNHTLGHSAHQLQQVVALGPPCQEKNQPLKPQPHRAFDLWSWILTRLPPTSHQLVNHGNKSSHGLQEGHILYVGLCLLAKCPRGIKVTERQEWLQERGQALPEPGVG